MRAAYRGHGRGSRCHRRAEPRRGRFNPPV